MGHDSRHQDGPGDERHEHDRQVDEEHGTPRELLQQQSANERAKTDADAGDAGPDGDGARPFLGREDVDDDGQGGGHDECGTHAHGGAGHDQFATGGRERGRQAGQPEDDQAALQRSGAAEPVTQRAHDQQQSGEHDDVGINHPLQLRAGRREGCLDGGQRHIEDGVVEADDDEAE